MNQVSPAPVDVQQPASNPAAWHHSDLGRGAPGSGLGAGSDRYAHQRRRLGERATIALDATVFRGADIRLTRTLDLSSTGCALEAGPEPLRGRVTLQLGDSSGERLRLVAYFRRSFQGGDAYEFAELTDADRLNVAEIIDTLYRSQH